MTENTRPAPTLVELLERDRARVEARRRELTRTVSELEVEDAYDRGRAAGYLDLGNTRRRRAVRRLELRVDELMDELTIRGYEPAASDRARGLEPDALRVAFRRMARRRLARTDGEPASVRNALRRAARELGDTHDLDLELILEGEGIELELERIRDRSRHGRPVEA